MANKKIKINRAPVLTLWAAVVAERLGYDEKASLTLGKAVAGLNAQSKGRRLGIYEEKSEEDKEKEVEEEKTCRDAVHRDRSDEACPPSKRRRVYALRSKASRSRPRASRPIYRRNSVKNWRMLAQPWRSWQKPIPPSSSKAKPTTYMKSSAQKYPRGRRAGAQKANSIWTISARWQSEAVCHSRSLRAFVPGAALLSVAGQVCEAISYIGSKFTSD